jgi:preprotein translocase SecF subunit
MRGLQIIPYNTTIDFVGMRKVAYALSLIIILGSCIALLTKGLNLGIDFRGGFLLEIRTQQAVNLADMRNKLSQLNMGEVKLQEFGTKNTVLIRLQRQPGGEKEQNAALDQVKHALGNGIEYRRVENVGPKVSEELIHNGLLAVAFALVGMLIYIWFRFEWQYGLCGILALLHDVIAVMGFYAVSGIEFNETAFAAILTTVGYSINDSVVIYDRLRENLRKYKKTPLAEVINLSANETLSRTMLTSGTTLVALAALSFFGGPVIENFSLPIFVGVLVGTASSIYISANLLLYFNLRRNLRDEEGQTANPVGGHE